MARDHEIKGIRYWDCDRCGFTTRWNETILTIDGFRVCTRYCRDESAKDPRRVKKVELNRILLEEGTYVVLTEEGGTLTQE